jgi:hypothetical protein
MRRLPIVLAALVVLAVLAAAPGAAEPGSSPVPSWGPAEDSPIRPGASLGGYCTFNWVFYDEVDPADPDAEQSAYIGTAGHCTDEVGERVSLPGSVEIGTVVYDSEVVGSDVDFSLIELDADRIGQTNPTMLGWGGPTGAITADELRFGVLVGWTEDEYIADMPAVWGDSGSPLLHHDSGKALGIISRFGFFETPPSTDVGPLMSWIFRELEAAGFGDVVLALATD